jgi:hypothetical protein
VLRPEAELLLCCARVHMEQETADRIRELLRQDLDWVYTIRTALAAGTLSLLYRNLSVACPEATPPKTLEQLGRQFEASALRSRLLTDELLRLVKLLKAHGIPAVPFKGPAVAALVYGDLALRQFADLDLLLHERDAIRAGELLSANGYQPWGKAAEARDMAARIAKMKDVAFKREDGNVRVELHWRFTPRRMRFLDLDGVWERTQPARLNGEEVRVLRPEDLLVVLCMHGAKHLWGRLDWICDVAELVRLHPEMEWSWVMEQAGAVGHRRVVLLGLQLAGDLLGAPIPPSIRSTIAADRAVEPLAAEVCERLFCEPPDGLGVVLSGVRFRLRTRERLPDRVREALHVAARLMKPTARDRSADRLPRPLAFVAYATRPVRIVREHGLEPVRRALEVGRDVLLSPRRPRR